MSGPVLEVGYKAEYIWEQNRQGLCLCGTYIHVKYSGLPLCGSAGKESACNAGDLSSTPGLGRSLEKEMATHSSILAWEIPRTEEPGGLQTMELELDKT